MSIRISLGSRLFLSIFLSAALMAAAAALSVSQPRRPLQAEDFYRTQQLSEPRCAPDGAWVAYVVTTNDRVADESRSAIWMVNWAGTEHVRLTNPAHGTHAPRWSPDGRYLAYLATPPGAEHENLLLLDRRGGEPRLLLSGKDDISNFEWSPDGSRIVFASLTGGEDAKTPKPIVIDSMHFKQDEEGYFATGANRHLYLLDVLNLQRTTLSSDAAYHEDLPVFSPDGRRIAFVRSREPGADPDGMQEIAIMDAQAGAAVTVLQHIHAPNTQALTWSPDGTQVAYLQGLEAKDYSYMQDRLAAVPAAGGKARALSDALDRAVNSYVFAPDSRSMTMSIEDDGTMVPARLDLATGTITKLKTGPFVLTALCGAAGHTAGLYGDDQSAAEVYALEGGALRKLTGHNEEWLADVALGRVEEIRFKSRDGTEVHGFTVKPPDFIAGRKYPTILWIHGGPNGQDQHTLDFDDYQFRRQLLAADGYLVVGVNYRGSSGRGLEFARAIRADWGHKEVEDLLAAMDHVVAQGSADPARLGLGGWSYGGILTDYTIASDRRFKAAASGAGSANQISMYGVDQYILQYNAEIGPPWRDSALWMKLSYPFFHADRIHTPTLFMGGDKDFNVPVAGGEQMYQALRTLGVPTQLVVYPGEFHEFKRPSFIVDRLQRVEAWFRRYLVD
jgi:dipeptidyl aminopeptidase/acylaminoacyl peptidase